MSQPEPFEVLILGSGQGGKLLAWHMARSGRWTAVVEAPAALSWPRLDNIIPSVGCAPPRLRPKRLTISISDM
jgi:pyruvate/2-oxoglutarate dehydrogenase complex dihydrolipoamide dehydrogenase (E3) component